MEEIGKVIGDGRLVREGLGEGDNKGWSFKGLGPRVGLRHPFLYPFFAPRRCKI